MTPGEELKAYRKAQGLTRQQFAKISLVSYELTRSWEDNRREMKPWHINYIELLKESKSFKQHVQKLKKLSRDKKAKQTTKGNEINIPWSKGKKGVYKVKIRTSLPMTQGDKEAKKA